MSQVSNINESLKFSMETFMKESLQAGVQLGHPTAKWNPYMRVYIREKCKGIHLIDLYKTRYKLIEACEFIKKIVASGKDILFVGTKQQAKTVIAQFAEEVGMPYVNERWLGGMLTNLFTLRKSINKMYSIEENLKSGLYSKKEHLSHERTHLKLKKNLGPVSTMKRLPGALFIVDINKEHIALSEANKLGIPIIAMCDTNTNPTKVNYPIPSNDDASKSIFMIAKSISGAIFEGLAMKKSIPIKDKEKNTSSRETTTFSKSKEIQKKTENKNPGT